MYRIVKVSDNKLIVQEKFLFFWITHKTRNFSNGAFDDGTSSFKVVEYFGTVGAAEIFIERLKSKKKEKKLNKKVVVKYID